MSHGLPYSQDISRTCSSVVMTGLDPAILEVGLKRLDPFIQALQKRDPQTCSPLLDLVCQTKDLDSIEKAVDQFMADATHLIVLGTGGSALGTAAIAQSAGYSLPFVASSTPLQVHIFDNLDAETFDMALGQLPLATTRFLAVSKSGGTLETMAQVTLVIQSLQEKGLSPADHVFVITEAKPNSLRALAEHHDLKTADHPDDIGGRFAVLTVVGMIPAHILGGNARAFREGAALVVNNLMTADSAADCPAAVGAALLIGLEETKGMRAHVCMAYGDRFERFTAWARQLWAESLGKEGRGSLFVPAIGPVDQHSQVQLYRDGPADKSYTVVMQEVKGQGKPITQPYGDTFSYIQGRTLGDIVDAEQRATADALVSRGLPVRVITCPVWDAKTMGALFMHWMLETIFAAQLMEINAYDQPAVEEGKIRAKAYLQDMA